MPGGRFGFANRRGEEAQSTGSLTGLGMVETRAISARNSLQRTWRRRLLLTGIRNPAPGAIFTAWSVIAGHHLTIVAALRQCGRFSQPGSQKNAVNSASSQASRSALLRLSRVSPEIMTHFSFSLASSDIHSTSLALAGNFGPQGHDVVVLVQHVQRMGA